jgi:oligopeptide transport system substrate-binding protein
MSTPRPIPDAQMDLLARRLAGVGIGRRDFLKIAAAVAAVGVPGVAASAESRPQPAPGGTLAPEQTLRFGGGGWYDRDPRSHDFNKDLYCGGVSALFAGLLKFDADMRAVPSVATAAVPNHDASVWTFTLRRDARWSDGSACTARDFEYSLKRQLEPVRPAPQAPYLFDIKNAAAFHGGRVKDPDLVGVRARDDWTLEVTLEGPRGYFAVLMGAPATLPAHRRSVEKYGDRWTDPEHIVSNGPFVLESWLHSSSMTLRKNPHYFGARDVRLDKVVIPILPARAGSRPYRRHLLDLTRLHQASVRMFETRPELAQETFRYVVPGTWYLIPQVTRQPFNDLRVRRAVAHAIDRDAVAGAGWGLAVAAHSMVPPGFPGARDDATVRGLQRFDPEQARALLRGTRYEGGRNWPKVVLSMRDEGYSAVSLAHAVQGDLFQHLNLNTELKVLDPSTFRERLWRQELQLVWVHWFMDYPDPQNEYADTFYGKKMTAVRQAWRSEAFDREIDAARQSLDQSVRLAHYARAEEILQTEAAYIPVAWVVGLAAAKPWVRGFETNRAGERMLDGDLYTDMLARLYIARKA